MVKKFKTSYTSLTQGVNTAIYSPNAEQYIVAGGKNIFFYDSATNKRKMEIELDDSDAAITTIALSPRANLLVVGCDNREVLSFAYPNSTDSTLMTRAEATIQHVHFSKTGSFLAVASDEEIIKLIFVDDHKQVKYIKGHEGAALCSAFDPKGDYIAAAGSDGAARIWKVDSGAQVHKFPNKINKEILHNNRLYRFAWSNDGTHFILPTGREIQFIKRDTWKVDFTLTDENMKTVQMVSLSPSGQYLAAVDVLNQCFIFDCRKSADQSLLRSDYENEVTSLAWSTAANQLMIADCEGCIGFWENVIPSSMPAPFKLSAADATQRQALEQLTFKDDELPSGGVDSGLELDNEDDEDEDQEMDEAPAQPKRRLKKKSRQVISDEDDDNEAESDDDDDNENNNKSTALELDNEEDEDNTTKSKAAKAQKKKSRNDSAVVDDEDDGGEEDTEAASSGMGYRITEKHRQLWQQEKLRRANSGKSGKSFADTLHPAFQPGATPIGEKHRFMAHNTVGMIIDHEENNFQSIEIEFHDTSKYRNIRFTCYNNFTTAALSESGAVFGAKSDSASESGRQFGGVVSFKPFSTWASNADWTYRLSRPGEDVEAVAATSNHVIAATSQQFIRIFTLNGVQQFMFSIPGPIVALAGSIHNNSANKSNSELLAVVYNAGFIASGQPVLEYMILALNQQRVVCQEKLPITRGSTLQWIGFTHGSNHLATYDSSGIVRIKSNDWSGLWMPVLDTMQLAVADEKRKYNRYWVSSVTDTHVLAYQCKNGEMYPQVLPRPFVNPIPYSVPFIKELYSEIEEKYMLQNMALNAQKRALIESGKATTSEEITADDVIKAEVAVDKLLISLIDVATKNDQQARALDYCGLLNLQKSFRLVKQIIAERNCNTLVNKMNQLQKTLFDGSKKAKREVPNCNVPTDIRIAKHVSQLQLAAPITTSAPITTEEGALVVSSEETPQAAVATKKSNRTRKSPKKPATTDSNESEMKQIADQSALTSASMDEDEYVFEHDNTAKPSKDRKIEGFLAKGNSGANTVTASTPTKSTAKNAPMNPFAKFVPPVPKPGSAQSLFDTLNTIAASESTNKQSAATTAATKTTPTKKANKNSPATKKKSSKTSKKSSKSPAKEPTNDNSERQQQTEVTLPESESGSAAVEQQQQQQQQETAAAVETKPAKKTPEKEKVKAAKQSTSPAANKQKSISPAANKRKSTSPAANKQKPAATSNGSQFKKSAAPANQFTAKKVTPVPRANQAAASVADKTASETVAAVEPLPSKKSAVELPKVSSSLGSVAAAALKKRRLADIANDDDDDDACDSDAITLNIPKHKKAKN